MEELKMDNAIPIVHLHNLTLPAHLVIKIVNTVLEVHSLNAQSVIHLNFWGEIQEETLQQTFAHALQDIMIQTMQTQLWHENVLSVTQHVRLAMMGLTIAMFVQSLHFEVLMVNASMTVQLDTKRLVSIIMGNASQIRKL